MKDWTRSSKSANRIGSTARPVARLFALSILLLSAACSSDSERPAPAHGSIPPLSLETLPRLAEDFALCQAVLRAEGAAFYVLEDTPIENGCGVTDAVRVNATSVAWNRNFPLTCATAAALMLWERDVLQPAAERRFGARVAALEHFGSYACRNRNNQTAGRRSEHARANAIDIGGFHLANGRSFSVEHGWRAPDSRADFLREVHRGACDVFQVTIGPDGDAHHYNHFHFDMGPWKSCS